VRKSNLILGCATAAQRIKSTRVRRKKSFIENILIGSKKYLHQISSFGKNAVLPTITSANGMLAYLKQLFRFFAQLL
jgi:hypothetical protein